MTTMQTTQAPRIASPEVARSWTREDTREINRRIGAELRRVRIQKGLSQTKLGELLGVTFQQVQKYETGANRLSYAAACRIASVCEVGVDAFAPAPAVGAGERLPQVSHEDMRMALAIGRLDTASRAVVAQVAAALGARTGQAG